MIDFDFRRSGDGYKARGFCILPSLIFSWLQGEQSYGLSLAWLSWSATLAWGKGTRP